MARQFQHKMATQLESAPPSRSISAASSLQSDREAKDALNRLRKSLHNDEMRLKDKNRVDNDTQGSIVRKVFEKNRRKAKLEREEEIDELASNPLDREDEIRLATLEETRPRWLTFSLKFFFHLMVFANFFTSWYDSARLLLEDAKMDLWLLEDDYNCLDIVDNVDVIDHSINILHALLSCSVLYVHNRNSATLCLAWVSSQAIHTIFKTFQYFYNLKFEKKAFGRLNGFGHLVFIIFFNAFGSLLLLHKYYDLTDRLKTRAKNLGTTDTEERCLNDKIIYKNETSFLQRKNILREVTTSQIYAIIKRVQGLAKQGKHIDPLALDREVIAAKLALQDCEKAENHNMMYVLKKAYSYRLRKLEAKEENALMGMVPESSSDGGVSHPDRHIHSKVF